MYIHTYIDLKYQYKSTVANNARHAYIHASDVVIRDSCYAITYSKMVFSIYFMKLLKELSWLQLYSWLVIIVSHS